MHRRTMFAAIFLGLVFPLVLCADPPEDIRELKLRDWNPQSMLVTKTTKVEKPAFFVIDDHNHLGTGKAVLTPERVRRYLEEMDAADVRTVVNLDGMWGDRLKETLAALDEAHPGRFLTYAQINFSGIDDDGWSRREAGRLEESFKMGAKGLKFHKSLGLDYRFKNGKYMLPDDPKMDAIYETCAKFGRPIMIHTADPSAFFTALDNNNERWHELNRNPDWLFFGQDFPPQKALLDAFIHAVAKHPKTTFIGAHLDNNAEDLATVSKWLDTYPNLMCSIDARISELGRQPYTARKFLIKHQDRVMFGTDTKPKREAFRIYYRFLETDDEYFNCTESHHLQGFWMIYGVFLPKDALEKIYHKNAERVLYFGDDRNSPLPTNLRSVPGEGLGVRADASPPVVGEKKKAEAPAASDALIRIPRTADFEVTGDGSAAPWKKAAWTSLTKLRGGKDDYDARFKMLYSPTGVYVLMTGSDRKMTATIDEDFADLWNEDVFEFFFWPDESETLYFEYEISPLNRELPILVPNFDRTFWGWRPWHYEGERKTRKAVSVSGGTAKPGAEITGWTAEVFVPYALLKPLRNVPPKPGVRWRANFYRCDYDGNRSASWSWTPVGSSFHEYEKFGTLLFE
jgi:predicted TIM-barrel fold metal-dependent hydrolase